MAQMSSRQMMGPWQGQVRDSTGVVMPKQPSQVPQKPFNVKGDAGIPTGKNGDGDGMDGAMDGSCY